MPKDRTTVVLHGGFHKTATTHIQGILKRNENYLRRQGTRYVHHRITRKDFTVPVQLNCYVNLGVPRRRKIYDEKLREMTSAFFSSLTEGDPERLILSDENFAGHCGQCVRGGQLYSYSSNFINVFAREIPFRVSEVHLAVRSYADFFAAAYVEFLRSLQSDTRPFRFVSESQMKKNVLGNEPSWISVLQDVKVAFPSAKIVVWRYEDYSKLSQKILANLCGPKVDIGRLKEPKAKKTRPTATGEAVKKLLALYEVGGLPELVEQRVAIQKRFSRDNGWSRYNPWNENEKTLLEAAYAADWDIIRNDARIQTLVTS